MEVSSLALNDPILMNTDDGEMPGINSHFQPLHTHTPSVSTFLDTIKMPYPNIRIPKKNKRKELNERKESSRGNNYERQPQTRIVASDLPEGYAMDAMGEYKIVQNYRQVTNSQPVNHDKPEDIRVVCNEDISIHSQMLNVEVGNDILIGSRTLKVQDFERTSYLPSLRKRLYHKTSTDVTEVQSLKKIEMPGNLSEYLKYMKDRAN